MVASMHNCGASSNERVWVADPSVGAHSPAPYVNPAGATVVSGAPESPGAAESIGADESAGGNKSDGIVSSGDGVVAVSSSPPVRKAIKKTSARTPTTAAAIFSERRLDYSENRRYIKHI